MLIFAGGWGNSAAQYFREMLIMLEFLQNNWGSLLVGAIILAVVVLIVIKLVRDRKAGKFTCGGNCGSCGACKGHCSGCSACSQAHTGSGGRK